MLPGARVGSGELHREGGVLPWHGGRGDGSVMGFYGTLDDGEPQSSAGNALLVVMFFDAVEALENEGEVGAGNADPIVADPESDLAVFVALAPDFELEGFGGILLEGVFDEVEEDLRPVEAVADEGEVFVDFLEFHFYILLRDDGFQAFDDVVNATREIEGREVEGGAFA